MSSADKRKAQARESDGHRRVDFRKDFEPLTPAGEKQEVLHAFDARDAAVFGIDDRAKAIRDRARELADDADIDGNDLEVLEEIDRASKQYLADYHAAIQEISAELNLAELEGKKLISKKESLRLSSLHPEAIKQADEMNLERQKSAKEGAKIIRAIYDRGQADVQEQADFIKERTPFREEQVAKAHRRAKKIAENAKLTPEEYDKKRRARLDEFLNPSNDIGNDFENVGLPAKDHKPKILTSNEERTQIDIERYNAKELSTSAAIEAGFEQTLSNIDKGWEQALPNKTEKPKPAVDSSKENIQEQTKFTAELTALGLDPQTIHFAESLFVDMLDKHSTSDKMAEKMVLLAARGVDSNKLDGLSTFIEKHNPSLAPTPEQINQAVEKIGMKKLVAEQEKATRLRTQHMERKTVHDDNLQAAVARRNDRLSRYEAELVGRAQADHPREVARTDAVDAATKKEWTRLFDLAEVAYVNAAGQALDTKRGDARSLGLTASAEVFASAGKSLAEVQSMAENFKKNAFMDKYMPTKQAYGAAEKSLSNRTDLLLEKTKPTVVQSLKNSWRKLWS